VHFNVCNKLAVGADIRTIQTLLGHENIETTMIYKHIQPDFQPHVYTDENLTRTSVSFRLSDHLPLWVEFELPQ